MTRDAESNQTLLTPRASWYAFAKSTLATKTDDLGANVPGWAVGSAPNMSLPLCGFDYAHGRSTVVVYQATTELGAYNHGAMMDFHHGFFFLAWKNGPHDEDSPSQRVLYATSPDGETWSKTDGRNVLFPSLTTNVSGQYVGAMFAGPTAILNGRRYATATPLPPFGLFPYPFASTPTSEEDSNTLLLREVKPDGALGPIFWASSKVPTGFEEASRRYNISTSTALGATVRADLALLADRRRLPCDVTQGTLKCEGCIGGCGNTTHWERTHYRVPHSAVEVILTRRDNNSLGFSYRSSASAGQTGWSEAADTQPLIPDVNSNLNAGELPDGRVFLVSNPCPKSWRGNHAAYRDPLVVSTSVDGFAFTRAKAVMSCEELQHCTPRILTGHPSGPSYPQAVTVTLPQKLAGLYVVATNNKEDVVVVRVPFESL